MALSAELFRKLLKLRCGRELAAVKQVSDFLKGAILDEVINVVTEIAKDAFLALNVAQALFVGDDPCESLGVFRFFRHH